MNTDTKGVLRHSSMESSNTNSSNSSTKKEGYKDNFYPSHLLPVIQTSYMNNSKEMRQTIKKIKSEIRRTRKMITKSNFKNAYAKIEHVTNLLLNFKNKYFGHAKDTKWVYDEVLYEVGMDLCRIHLMSSLIIPLKPSTVIDTIKDDWKFIYNECNMTENHIQDDYSNIDDITNIKSNGNIHRNIDISSVRDNTMNIFNDTTTHKFHRISRKTVYIRFIDNICETLNEVKNMLREDNICHVLDTVGSMYFGDLYESEPFYSEMGYHICYTPIDGDRQYCLNVIDIMNNSKFDGFDMLKKVIKKSYFKDFYDDLILYIRVGEASISPEGNITMPFIIDDILDPNDGSILLNYKDISNLLESSGGFNHDIQNDNLIRKSVKYSIGIIINATMTISSTENLKDRLVLPIYDSINNAVDALKSNKMLRDDNYLYKILSDYMLFNDTTDSIPIQNLLYVFNSFGDDKLTKRITSNEIINNINNILFTFTPYSGVRNIHLVEDGINEVLRGENISSHVNKAKVKHSPDIKEKYIILYRYNDGNNSDTFGPSYLRYYTNANMAIGKVSFNIVNTVEYDDNGNSNSKIRYSIDAIYNGDGLILDDFNSPERVYNVINGKSLDVIRNVELVYDTTNEYSNVTVDDCGNFEHMSINKKHIPIYDTMFSTLEEAVEYCRSTQYN